MKDFCIVQHVSFETPGFILEWIKQQGHSYFVVKPFLQEPFPNHASFRFLVIMGGPMGIHDDSEFPWLIEERSFISKATELNKPVLGICLGAQFLANALGSNVTQNAVTEIGWMPIYLTEHVEQYSHLSLFPKDIEVLHWHGDTFSLPPDCIHLYRSKYCSQQAFCSKDLKWIGLQFHLEIGYQSLRDLIEQAYPSGAIHEAIQSPQELLSRAEIHTSCQNLLYSLLAVWVNTNWLGERALTSDS